MSDELQRAYVVVMESNTGYPVAYLVPSTRATSGEEATNIVASDSFRGKPILATSEAILLAPDSFPGNKPNKFLRKVEAVKAPKWRLEDR